MPWQRTTGLLFKRLHKAARLFADEAHHGVPPIGSRNCISIKMILMLSMSIRAQKSDRVVRRNPVAIITKNRLVTRDIDLLCGLSAHNAVAVNVSVTSLDSNLQRVLEPRTSSPQARLDAIRQLRSAGIPTGVMVAPIIPGLTDHEVPGILEACAKAGAQFAAYTIVRLPWAVAPLFEHWLEEHFPDRKEKVIGRIRDLRGKRLNNSQWHTRMTGEGIFAEHIASMFAVSCRRNQMCARPKLSSASFQRQTTQLGLFG